MKKNNIRTHETKDGNGIIIRMPFPVDNRDATFIFRYIESVLNKIGITLLSREPMSELKNLSEKEKNVFWDLYGNHLLSVYGDMSRHAPDGRRLIWDFSDGAMELAWQRWSAYPYLEFVRYAE